MTKCGKRNYSIVDEWYLVLNQVSQPGMKLQCKNYFDTIILRQKKKEKGN